MRRVLIAATLTSLFLMSLVASTFAQRADRGIVTGVVQDPTEKTVVGAVVKVKNDDTGVVTELTTNEAGRILHPRSCSAITL